MSWTILDFGRHKGKTLPQVIFADPDWFFWAIDKNIFSKRAALANEAKELYQRARNIRVPQKDKHEKMIAEYAIHAPTGKFANMELIPDSRPNHVGSTTTFRKNVIDLRTPREIAPYDKLGCKNIIHLVKYYFFGNKNVRMSQKKCEEFFENNENFT
ncbi:MAG: hypothetical protein WCG61_04435 [Chlorobium sp.]